MAHYYEQGAKAVVRIDFTLDAGIDLHWGAIRKMRNQLCGRLFKQILIYPSFYRRIGIIYFIFRRVFYAEVLG